MVLEGDSSLKPQIGHSIKGLTRALDVAHTESREIPQLAGKSIWSRFAERHYLLLTLCQCIPLLPSAGPSTVEAALTRSYYRLDKEVCPLMVQNFSGKLVA